MIIFFRCTARCTCDASRKSTASRRGQTRVVCVGLRQTVPAGSGGEGYNHRAGEGLVVVEHVGIGGHQVVVQRLEKHLAPAVRNDEGA